MIGSTGVYSGLAGRPAHLDAGERDSAGGAILFQHSAGRVLKVVHADLVGEEGGVGGHVEESPGGQRQVQTIHDADDEDVAQVPCVGQLARRHLVL